MSLRPSSPARSLRPRHLAAALGFALLAGLAPAAVSAADPVAPRGGLQPTVHYEDAVAHAHDRIAFAPGGRVTVPFRPRATDRWTVDGRAPRALPAGLESGRTMRRAAPPEVAATDVHAPRTLPGDRPIVDPAAIVPADGVAWDAAEAPAFELAAAVDPGALRREVFGFLPYWELTDSSTRLDWDKISTVAYFGVGADSKGNLIRHNSDGGTTVGWSGWTSSKMTSVINAAHASHARVVLTVQSFAWSSTGLKRQKALLGSSTARANLARQIAAAIRNRGADGVNLDFEPIASGYADEFTALVRKVRSTLDATAHGYQLTFDTTGWIGNYPVEAATRSGGADAIFIMGYDYRSSGSSATGSIAPIGGPTYDVRDTIKAYLDRVPPSKLILGVPYYGRAWSTASDNLHSRNISSTKNGTSVTAVYGTARDLLAAHGRRYDATEGVAWTAYRRENCTKTYGCVTVWRQLYIDDAKALRAKYDLVNGYGLRGIGIWALGYDGTRPELYQAIEDKFITDTVPPVIKSSALSRSVFSPNRDGRAETTTASLSATGLVRWGYTVRRLSGSSVGDPIRSGTRAGRKPSFTWDGRDAAGAVAANGSYRITLWTADVSDNRAERRFTVVLDTRKAIAATRAGAGFITPNADRHNDTVLLTWSSDEALTGAAQIRDAAGHVVRSWSFTKRRAWSGTWTGKNTAGTVVRDGRYVVHLSGLDRAGNRTVVDRTVLVDRTITAVHWSDRSFDPRAHQTSRVVTTLRRTATVSAAIYHGDTLVRTIWSARSFKAGAHGWTWNGKTAAGATVKPGTYKIVVTAKSTYGTTRFATRVTVESH